MPLRAAPFLLSQIPFETSRTLMNNTLVLLMYRDAPVKPLTTIFGKTINEYSDWSSLFAGFFFSQNFFSEFDTHSFLIWFLVWPIFWTVFFDPQLYMSVIDSVLLWVHFFVTPFQPNFGHSFCRQAWTRVPTRPLEGLLFTMSPCCNTTGLHPVPLFKTQKLRSRQRPLRPV